MKRLLLGAVVALSSTLAAAQVPATCDQPRPLASTQLLRRLSLDLRGRAPSQAEYATLASQPVATTISAFIHSEDFRKVARRYHEDQFWPNVSNVALNNTNAQLVQKGAEPATSLAGVTRRVIFRNDPDISTAHGDGCGDFLQTHFDPAHPNEFRPDPAFVRVTTLTGGKRVYQEGYRLVRPYWAPTGPDIKVCAFDAQETESVVLGTRTYQCGDPALQGGENSSETATAAIKRACGCGKNLKWCYGPRAKVADVITSSLREQLNLAVDDVTVGGKPYKDLLLATTARINGPITYWKKYLAQDFNLLRVWSMADPNEALPDFKGSSPDELWFTDTTWKSYDRSDPALGTAQLHAGILTLPAYLLRFQTNRARANRYANDFQCAPFIPAPNFESPPGCLEDGTDLVRRCNCRGCHQRLEPIAAHFGQFAEAGSQVMTDLLRFPRMAPNCNSNNPSPFCARFYATNPAGDRPGSLLAYQYAVQDGVHDGIYSGINNGPQRLAQADITSGTFGACVVRRTFAYFMKRDMRVVGPGTNDEFQLMLTLATAFRNSNYDWPALVGQIVSLEQYRGTR